MKLVHESVVEGGEVFETVWAGFLQSFEKEDLSARIELLEQLAQLGHGIAAGRDTQDIVNKSLDKLLGDIFAVEVAIWEFAGGEELVKWDGLRSKGD